jgi:hypothetical protein
MKYARLDLRFDAVFEDRQLDTLRTNERTFMTISDSFTGDLRQRERDAKLLERTARTKRNQVVFDFELVSIGEEKLLSLLSYKIGLYRLVCKYLPVILRQALVRERLHKLQQHLLLLAREVEERDSTVCEEESHAMRGFVSETQHVFRKESEGKGTVGFLSFQQLGDFRQIEFIANAKYRDTKFLRLSVHLFLAAHHMSSCESGTLSIDSPLGASAQLVAAMLPPRAHISILWSGARSIIRLVVINRRGWVIL